MKYLLFCNQENEYSQKKKKKEINQLFMFNLGKRAFMFN